MREEPAGFSVQEMSKIFQDKLTTPDEAVSVIRPGDKVFIATACATPRTLIMALENLETKPADVHLLHFLTDGAVPRKDGVPHTKYHHRSFFVGTDTREIVNEGRADYVPISLPQACALFRSGRVVPDVALIQVSLPDKHGHVSLGVSVDITRTAVEQARTVIAEINPNMPWTLGDTVIPVDCIDHAVLVDTPVAEYTHPHIMDAISEQIARYVARIIEDGSTLQIGLGRIPNEMLKYLANRRDLGIHSDVITEPIIDLIEEGIVTGNAKTLHKGQVVASYCLGTRRLYDFVDRNPTVAFYPIEYICDPAILARNSKLVSVTQAFAIDLTGQVCSDQFEGEFYSGVSTQPEFLRGSAGSPGGKPIVCLSSITEDGENSRIRPLLHEGEGVTISRSEIHYVITEYGTAYLFGKSIRERALSLIEIAHPDFRPWLLEEAKRLGYVRKDQVLKSRGAYPHDEDREIELRNGTKVLIRPARASDYSGLQDLFYHLSPKDVITRFFTKLNSLSESKAQHLCNVDYEHEMAFVAVTGEKEEDECVVGSSCYYMDQATRLADIAYMIRPEWQGQGLGSCLQDKMIEYAKSKGIRGFTADILTENEKMIKLAYKCTNNVCTSPPSYGSYEVTMMFEN
ncbi:MAG: GNAT family N-acetyltransferase [Deltaproteobacteria bacterium]|nr:GNAT family N-acetyltransferase [Deltaproteobacteria bacterium]